MPLRERRRSVIVGDRGQKEKNQRFNEIRFRNHVVIFTDSFEYTNENEM